MKATLALALVGVLLAVRFTAVGAYQETHPDEGFWASGARNFVRFGEPLMDGRLHPFLSPATFVELSGWFLILPASLTTARWASAFLGVLTCFLVWGIARRVYPDRPWLMLLLFGFSSITILIHRIGLLEARQMFWLTLAAYLWLSEWRGSSLAAGVAYGVALLVKTNSVYLLPAFLLTPIGWSALGSFVPGFLLTSGGGYLTAWALDPAAFLAAFRYEIDGQHWLDSGVLFHIGRFGLHPARLLETLRGLFVADPVMPLLALGGLGYVLRGWRTARRAEVFFAAWFLGGLAFTLGQIYCPYRYLTTLAPAFAFLATRPLHELATQRWGYRVAVGVLILACLAGPARVSLGLVKQPNADYWQGVEWIATNVPRADNVLVTPVLGLSLPQRSYDYYRLINTYDGSVRPLAAVVARYQIEWIVVDAEWRSYETPDMAAFLAEHCTRQGSPGACEVWRVER
jgi:hypothetical protein